MMQCCSTTNDVTIRFCVDEKFNLTIKCYVVLKKINDYTKTQLYNIPSTANILQSIQKDQWEHHPKPVPAIYKTVLDQSLLL